MKVLIVLVVAAGLGAGAMSAGEEWPQWRGPRGDGISKETGLLEEWPADGPAKLWTQPVGLGFSSPIGFGGNVYLFSEVDGKEVLTCFNADSGKPVWSETSDSVHKKVDYPGTRATSTIADGRIYTYGVGGELICRDLENGKAVWSINVLQTAGGGMLNWGQASSPLVSGDLVYVQGGDGGPIAVAIDRKSGKVAWSSEAQGKSSYAAIVLADTGSGQQQLIVFGGHSLFGMDPQTGRTLWQEEWKTGADVNAATPIYQAPNLLVSSGYKHGAMMLKLSGKSEEKLWTKMDVECKFQAPILDGGYLYANSEERRGTIICISWPQGDVQWSAEEKDLHLEFGGSMVRFGDKLLTLSAKGRLSLLKATPQGVQKISQVEQIFAEAFDNDWSTPLIYRGRLYAKGRQELVCFDLRADKAAKP